MAFRDLGRNRRRSFFSALALAIGLALLLLMASVINGEMRSSMSTSVNLQSGHLQVRVKSYSEDKTSLDWKDLIENPAAVAAQVAALQPVKVATPRLFASGIVNAGDQALGVRIIGVDPASAANAPYRDGLVSGQFVTADDREGLVIGQALADKLNLKAGDAISLLVNTSSGEVDTQNFTVRGIYTTHTSSYDQTMVLMPLAKAQAITRTENHASTIFVLLNDRDQTAAVVAALQSGQYEIKTWEQMNDLMIQTEQMSNAYMFLLYLIVLGITATVIVNTLIMSVFERTREIGILSAIGMKGYRIMAMFFAESSLLAVGGIVMGLALGGLMVAYATQYGFYIGNVGTTGIMLGDTIYAYPNPKDFVNLTLMAFIVTLLAALYPALLAANMEPVEALHGGK
jgi:ABC-type lipoprotein release transport system permease subunit